MKKIVVSALSILIIAIYTSLPSAFAYVTGEAVYTDIKLNLNGIIIPCYNVDSYVVIPAEDLSHYGFDVNWNEESKTLYINRNPEYYKITEKEYNNEKGISGTHYADIYDTDITVEFNGRLIEAYSINGKMLIKPETALISDGITFSYEDDEQMLYMKVEDLEEAQVYPLAENLCAYKTADTIWVEDNGAVIIKEHTYDYKDFDDVYAKYFESYGYEYICIIDRQHGTASYPVDDLEYSTHIYSRAYPDTSHYISGEVTDVIGDCFLAQRFYDSSIFHNGDDHPIVAREQFLYEPDGTILYNISTDSIDNTEITYINGYTENSYQSARKSILLRNGKRIAEYNDLFCREGVGDTILREFADGKNQLVDFDGNILFNSDLSIQASASGRYDDGIVLVQYDAKHKLYYYELFDHNWNKVKSIFTSKSLLSISTSEYNGEKYYTLSSKAETIVFDKDFNLLKQHTP